MIKELGASGILKIGDKVLLIRRASHDTDPGQWEFPKGKTEEGESPSETAVREFKEETGLVVSIVSKITVTVWGYKRGGKVYEITESVFEVKLEPGQSVDDIILSDHDKWQLADRQTVEKIEPIIEARREFLLKSLG